LKDRHYASPIVIDGILYAINRTRTLSAVDAETGELLHQQQFDLGRGGSSTRACLMPAITFSSITTTGPQRY